LVYPYFPSFTYTVITPLCFPVLIVTLKVYN